MPDRCPVQFVRFLIGAALLLPLATQAQTEGLYQVELLVFSYPAGGTAEQWEATPDLAYPEATRFLTMPGERSAAALPVADAPVPAQPPSFATLPATQREFASKADAMQRSGRYQILFHETWLQPMTNQSAAVPIVLDRSGDGGQWPALQGTITLYMSSDVNLETNLWLNTQGEYLHSMWRMPPPPLGPASSARETPLQTAPELHDTTANPVAPGSAYPFRHAVLLQQTRRMRSGEVNYLDHPMLGVVAKITALSEVEPEATAPPEATVQPGTTVPPKPGPAATPPT
jgi:hypothetical protein